MSKIKQVKIPVMGEPIIQTTCDSCMMEAEVPASMIPYQEKLEQMSKKILKLTDEVEKLKKNNADLSKVYVEYRTKYENISNNYTHQCENCKQAFHSKNDVCYCQYCRHRCVAL